MKMKTVKIEKTLDAVTYNIATFGPTTVTIANSEGDDWKTHPSFHTAYLDTSIDVSGWTKEDKGLILTNASIRMLAPKLGGGTYAYEWLYVSTTPFLGYSEVRDEVEVLLPPSIQGLSEEVLCSPTREGPAWSQLMFGKQYGWANNVTAFAGIRAVPFTCVTDGSGAVAVGDKIYIRRVWGQEITQVGFSDLSEMRIVLEGALVDMKEHEQVMALSRQSLKIIQADED